MPTHVKARATAGGNALVRFTRTIDATAEAWRQ